MYAERTLFIPPERKVQRPNVSILACARSLALLAQSTSLTPQKHSTIPPVYLSISARRRHRRNQVPLILDLPPLNQGHGTHIPLPCHKHIVHRRTNERGHKQHAGPVEACGRHGVVRRPEGPEETPQRVDDGGGVERDAPAAQAEGCGREGLGVADAPPEETADGEAVALEQGDGQEGCDGWVEGEC